MLSRHRRYVESARKLLVVWTAVLCALLLAARPVIVNAGDGSRPVVPGDRSGANVRPAEYALLQGTYKCSEIELPRESDEYCALEGPASVLACLSEAYASKDVTTYAQLLSKDFK